MTTSPALVIAAALAAGGVAAVGTATLMAPETAAEASDSSPSAQAIDSLRHEVQRLADEQSQMTSKLQTLELRMTAANTSGNGEVQPLAGTAPELAELQQQVAQLNARVGGGDTGEPMVIETVSAALEQIRDQEDADRRKARDEARAERTEERLAELTEELGLDSYQQGKMSGVMTTYGESRDSIMESARESGDFGGLRDSFEALHGQISENLAGFLTPSQIEMLDGMGGTRSLGGGGGRGGGPGGFGGRGGRGGDN